MSCSSSRLALGRLSTDFRASYRKSFDIQTGQEGYIAGETEGAAWAVQTAPTVSVPRHSAPYVIPDPQLLLELKQRPVGICVQSLIDRYSLREAGTRGLRDG